MPRKVPNVFVVLEHTSDGVDSVGVYPTAGAAEEARATRVRRVARERCGQVTGGATQVMYKGRCLFWYTVHRAPGFGLSVTQDRGGKTATGNYATRAELIDRVKTLFYYGTLTRSQIADSVGVSTAVTSKIIRDLEAERQHGR